MSAQQAIWKRLDELITWYERFKPAAGMRIEVDLTPAEIWRLSARVGKPEKAYPRELAYRGRTIVARKS